MTTNREETTPDVTVTAEPSGGTTPAVEAPASPTITHYQQLASRFMAAMNEIELTLPQLEAALNLTDREVRTRLTIPIAFLSTVTVSVEQSPELQSRTNFDVTAARDTLQFLDAFSPVRDKISGFYKKVKRIVDVPRAILAASALQVYAIAKRLASDPGGDVAMALHVENMKRDLGRKGRPKTSLAQRKAAAAAAAASSGLGVPTRQLLPSHDPEEEGS